MGLKVLLLVSTFFALLFYCKASVLGGSETIDINDPHVVKSRDFILDQLKSSNGVKSELQLISAKRKVVAGSLITLTFRKINEDNEFCSVSLWERPWLNKKEITSSTCGHDISQAKTDETHLLLFDRFVGKYGKKYATKEEYKKRYHIFKSNLKTIKLMNDMEQGTAKYGVNEFADMSSKEFSKYLGLVKSANSSQLPQAKIPDIAIPDSFDWRDHNAVTPVKNQGFCGSCWAFSVTGNVEGVWAVQHGELLSLSEQELVDCDKADNGCNGGEMTTAYTSVVSMGGLESETDYPYEGKDDSCQINRSEIQVQISGGVNISSDESDMAKWLVQNGPISIGVNANAMQFYLGGVSHPFKIFCNPNQLDHGVLIVGYGETSSKILKRKLPYWIIKNSWGKRWGELGYYRLYRGDGSCGVNQMASSAVL